MYAAGSAPASTHRPTGGVKTGGPIPIAYLPGQPRQHCIDYPWELDDISSAPLDDFAVGMFVFVPGLCLIWHFARRNRVHAWLLAKGAETWGEVSEVRKTHTRQGSYTYLIFLFTTASGREIEGRTSTLPESERIHWQQGDPIRSSTTRRSRNNSRLTCGIRSTGSMKTSRRPRPSGRRFLRDAGSAALAGRAKAFSLGRSRGPAS